MRSFAGWLGIVVAGALIVTAPQLAAAQKRGRAGAAAADQAAAGADQAAKARIERTAGGGKVIKLTPILVEGKVQKPLALVLARSAIQYDWEQLKQKFTPKILDAVSKSPF